MARQLPRALHPLAWWGWAIGVAFGASFTTNPLLLALLVGVVWLVVIERRGESPWARAFHLYVGLAVVIVVLRVVLHILVGLKFGTILVLPLPSIALPSWAAGINLLGNVYLEGLLGAALLGARLGVLIIAIGAANALANPKRLLRALPSALNEIGTAVIVAVSVAPQLAESVQRVVRARLLRGDNSRGIRALPRVALPVLQDTLDRSLLLAAAMESRGFGRKGTAPHRALTATVTLSGLLIVCLGMYAALDPGDTPTWLGLPTLALGVLALGLGLWLGGRGSTLTNYRADPWRWPESLTVVCGLAVGAGVLISRHLSPLSLDMPLQPLSAPVLPVPAMIGALVALLPAYFTPRPAKVVR